MNQVITYQKELRNMSPRKWEDYLLTNSGLPGPRANITLAEAFARTGTLLDFKKFIFLEPHEAQENTPRCFLVMCGVMGIGQYLSKYQDEGLFHKLRKLANDPRRSVRKAVTLALQMIGKRKTKSLLKELRSWVTGTYYEQNCVAVALSEPALLGSKDVAEEALDMLDLITVHLVGVEPRNDGLRQLKRSLGYCWSVVVSITPRKGRKRMERWIREGESNIQDIMNENLKRLHKLDPDWTDAQIAKIKW